MTNDPSGDLELLRRELAELGLDQQVTPEDFGLEFRSADSLVESAAPSVPRKRYQRWVPATLGAAAALLLAAGIAIPQIDGGSDDPSQPTTSVAPEIVTVSQVLRRAADASAAMVDRTGARFWQVEALQQQGQSAPERRTTWYGHREPGLLVDDFGRVELPPATFALERSSLTWDQVVALPVDAASLRRLLDREVKGLPDPEWYAMKVASMLLAESPAPPAVRSALWRALAELPGVTSRDEVLDASGREGVGLTLTSPGRGRLDVIVDPDRGTVLEITTDSTRVGTEPFRTTYLSQGPATSIP